MNKKELHDFIKEKQPNICQISCYKDGKEVYSDEWNNYKKIDTCHVMSATKSIVALLVGIALDKGLILSRLVDTFFSRISLTMPPAPKSHNTAYVLPWEEPLHWQSRSSGYSSS